MDVATSANLASASVQQWYRLEPLKAFVYRTAVLALLLITVPTLTVRIKSGLGSPSSDPGRHLRVESKMRVTHPPLAGDWRKPIPRFSQLLPVPDGPAVPLMVEPEVPVRRVSLTICLQHRSPPSQVM
jgi:hypothetical protein